MFLYRHSVELQALARRRSDRWAAFRKPVPGELVRKAGHAYSDDRYVAVNCNNQRTYELRFFRATLDATEFMAAVEFADASVEYTRGIKTADILRGNGLTWSHFEDWVTARNYPALSAELAKVSEVAARERALNDALLVAGWTSLTSAIEGLGQHATGAVLEQRGMRRGDMNPAARYRIQRVARGDYVRVAAEDGYTQSLWFSDWGSSNYPDMWRAVSAQALTV